MMAALIVASKSRVWILGSILLFVGALTGFSTGLSGCPKVFVSASAQDAVFGIFEELLRGQT